MLKTQRNATSSPVADAATLDTHPRWREYEATRLRLESEQRQLESEIESARKRPRGDETLPGAILAAAKTGAPLPTAEEVNEIGKMEARQRAIHVALVQHQQSAPRIRAEVASEICKGGGWEARHLDARRDLVRAIIAAKRAHDAELALAVEMTAVGALANIQYRLLANFSSAALLPAALGESLNLGAFMRDNKNLID
jgi:hypothetical protein